MEPIFKEIAERTVREQQRVIGVKRNQLSLWIGRLVISFNDLEKRLSDALGREFSADDATLHDMFAASMSFGQKLDLLAAISLQHHRENVAQQTRIKRIVGAISSAEEFRNAVIQSAWVEPSFISTEFVRRKPKTKGRKGLRVDEERANIAELRTAVQDTWFLGVAGVPAIKNPSFLARYGIDDSTWDTVKARFSRQ